ncbi:MAG: hypothetical protein KKH52_01540, partial [Nanoarchaeota archaeon]|nr:hypothetical protein [Nanoarchaeota archaeon]
MKPFPVINLENKPYPSVIMGEDHFTGWFKKCKKYSSEKARATDYQKTIQIAYDLGVRGFSISPHLTLIKVLKKFKQENSEIVCIANPHWQSNYYLGKESLWSKKNMERLAASEKYYSKSDCLWFKEADIKKRFSKEEINAFTLDEKEYQQQLKTFSFCDFSLVGNLGRSALVLLNRTDLIKREIALVRKAGLIPLGICEGGALALLQLEKLNLAGTWVWINRHFCCPNLNTALKVIKQSKKPITGYKILSTENFNLEKSISFIKSIKQIKSIVVGVNG